MNDPIKLFEISFLAIASFNLFVLSFKILFSFKQYQPAHLFLLFWLLIAGTALTNMYLIDSGIIFSFPRIYRLPTPLFYLMFPFAYFYVRMIVTDKTSISKWDFIHFMPALLHLFEMIPFFLKPDAYKLEVLLNNLNNPLVAFTHKEGILPSYYHNILRGMQGIGYALAMLIMLNNKKYKDNVHLNVYPEILKWLKAFSLIQFLIGIIMVIFLGFPQLAPPSERATLLYVLFATVLSGTSILLIFNPIILYGIPKLTKNLPVEASYPSPIGVENDVDEVPQEEKDIKIIKNPEITPYNLKTKKEQLIIDRLEKFMDSEKPFLKSKITSGDIATGLGIPSHHLSYILNHVMCVRFSDYVNEKRINFMKETMDQNAIQNYTLEALAFSSGFNSRITFIRAVKKLKGINPSAYFGKKMEGEN